MVDRVHVIQAGLKPKKSHGYSVLLFIFGTLLPPLAVAARFGIGLDFFINLVLTICGYIPGHVHNFYIQNVRNNKTKRRTPKWVQKYGLVDTEEIQRKERRSQWALRYNDRLPRSTLEGRPVEEGQEAGGSSIDLAERQEPRADGANGASAVGEYWGADDERYYGQQNGDAASTNTRGSGGWHYPANFDDALPPARKKSSKKGKKDKKDRWARTEDAYSVQEEGASSGRRRKSKKRRSAAVAGDADAYSQRSESTSEFPEDPEGGLYGDRQPAAEETPRETNESDIFNHEL